MEHRPPGGRPAGAGIGGGGDLHRCSGKPRETVGRKALGANAPVSGVDRGRAAARRQPGRRILCIRILQRKEENY